ncbi:Fic family protein [Spongiactinospora sp. TRM90649]|uniref:Fic family protein n=1 Tax=Spongiactinospora sp. TRM90649 TaxID=3031114 RepID=UPI0023F7AAF0|nr:Fic family protein [Spongiactinospora sp. TRM90649]MDF5757035.1 Fic family protein [Spongiactinospora sp. TRM90649]
MLYGTPDLAPADLRVLAGIDAMRRDLRRRTAGPRRWEPLFVRHLTARAIAGSAVLGGYRPPPGEVESIVAGEPPPEASAPAARAIAGHRQALTYVGLLCRTRAFRYEVGLLAALNFMMTGHRPDRAPGTFRSGGASVRDQVTGAVVYEAPRADRVPGLARELADWLNDGDLDAPAHVRAAVAHLNLAAIRPWREGNGRMARALQALVLGRDGLVPPEFGLIDEWVGAGRAAYDYHDALAGVRGQGWSPHGATLPWVRFVLRCQHMQAQRLGRRLAEAERVWTMLEETVRAEGLPARCAAALYQVFAATRVRRGTYQADESLSPGQSARDLRELTRRGWLTPYGETKARHYGPGPRINALRSEFDDRAEPIKDPYQK